MATAIEYLGSGAHVRVVERSPMEAEAAGVTGSILVAEDDASVRKVVGSTLRRAGHQVVLARNAAEAMTMLARFPVDLLIADVILPDMPGPELADRCRRERPGIRVLFISGYGIEVLEERGLRAADLLEKPFSPALLRLKVEECLGR